ncbi:MAG TPA: hypothetical protein VGI60_10650 [Chthoniobacterales bacterium]|jgi:hypothetical protein
MFKAFRDGANTARIRKAMNLAGSALTNGKIEIADVQLEKAYKLLLDTRLPRMMHIELITFWGLIGHEVRKQGYTMLADHCDHMNKLLQARFDAGDYYSDSN